MADRDFFSFCTTLKPLELKALGELSFIQHLAPQRVIYKAGDASSALYLVTRGSIELVQEGVNCQQPIFLTRGEFVGDLEAITNSPRRYTARARDAASVQCFLSDDFPALLQRVPAFFLFLTQHFAARLQTLSAQLTARPNESLELSGNLANFDVITIYQTILSSGQTGELHIRNEQGDTMAVFYFQDGHPRTGQFAHLTGEEAFTQFFAGEQVAGTFHFSSGAAQISSSIQSPVITRNANDLLINALRARDELAVLKRRFADCDGRLYRRRLNFAWPEEAPPQLEATARQIWELGYTRPLAVAAFYERCAVSELKIYEAIDVLIQSGHFELLGEEVSEKVA